MSESPKPKKDFDFYKALDLMFISQKRITKRSWSNPDEYGIVIDGRLKIHRNGKDFDWILTDGDILGVDYYVL